MAKTSGISACILARNEEHRIEDALRSLQGWTDQITVIDNESTDGTVEIARRYADVLLSAPRANNFDAARNLAIEHATGEWIFYLDADERVPPRLGEVLRRLVRDRGHEFEALQLPFKHYFCGRWMRNGGWWPGYTRPQLLKKGCFQCGERLHSGVTVDGRTLLFPADDSDHAIVHHSYDDIRHYLSKLNAYTDGEAESLRAAGESHSWQAQIAHFVHDWRIYYDRWSASRDGMHGFQLAFLSAAYRFLSRAKLWDLRRKRGELVGDDPVPSSVREVLELMVAVVRDGPDQWLVPTHPPAGAERSHVPPHWYHTVPHSYGTVRSRALQTPLITACILARNEEHRIEDALRSLQGWTDQIIVIDNESTDGTVEIARRYADVLLSAPRANNFDAARNLAIEHAIGEWIFYLDADERVPSTLARVVRRLVEEHGDQFDDLQLPSRNFVCGKWLQSPAWWPGYSSFLHRKGRFRYGDRLHSGVEVEGRVLRLPADDPELSVVHESHADISSYVAKLNNYTDAEGENLLADGCQHSWQVHLACFVDDWRRHYDELRAREDGMHGFVFAFLCSFYRFAALAKLWDLRRKHGALSPEEQVPGSLSEMIQFMARIYDEGTGPRVQPAIPAACHSHAEEPRRVPLLWCAPFFDPSGYADEARNFALALVEAGVPLAISPMNWGEEDAGLPPEVRKLLTERVLPYDTPTEIFISQTTPPLNRPSRCAQFNVARTMFETDRLQRVQFQDKAMKVTEPSFS